MKFSISQEVKDVGVNGIYFTINGMKNDANAPYFDGFFEQICGVIWNETSKESIKTNPVLIGFRDLHSAVGVSNRKNVASSENLLRMLENKKILPRINLLVDIYNLISIQTRLSLGAHDLSMVTGSISLRLTNGTEKFLPLGQKEIQTVKAGEYSYVDDGNDVICRMEVRQVEKTKITVDTTDAFYIVQGNLNTPYEDILYAATELARLTKKFCGGEVCMLYPENIQL